jgi:hypothetical protein
MYSITEDISGLGVEQRLLSQIVPGVDLPGELHIWRGTGATVVDGKVASWGSYGGDVASQETVAARPAWDAANYLATFDGVDDVLLTDLPLPAEGIFALRTALVAAPGAIKALAGVQDEADDRCWFGVTSALLATLRIGDTTLSRAGALTLGQFYTMLVAYDDTGAFTYRVDGVEIGTGNFISPDGTLGAAPISLGGYTFANVATAQANCKIAGGLVGDNAGGYDLAEIQAAEAYLATLGT